MAAALWRKATPTRCSAGRKRIEHALSSVVCCARTPPSPSPPRQTPRRSPRPARPCPPWSGESEHGTEDETMSNARRELVIPAGHARLWQMRAGERVTIAQTEGHQVGDFIAFNAADLTEFLSPSHTRRCINRYA